jgi:hypothetical protein
MPKSQRDLRRAFNQNGFDFLMVDLDAGIAFAERALVSPDPDAKRRNAMNARKAYKTVARFRDKLSLDSEQQNAFDRKQMSLKKVLDQLGEQF